MGFESLSDEALLKITRDAANVCFRVTEMSEEERHTVSTKRGTSPEQAAVLSAWIAEIGLAECARRGLA